MLKISINSSLIMEVKEVEKLRKLVLNYDKRQVREVLRAKA